MSRTDIHRPYWVQMNDPTVRHWFRDWHDHINGICDLEEFLAPRGSLGPYPKHYCYRQQGWSPRMCGCHLCTWASGRKLQRRQERVLWRTIRQDLLKAAPEDFEDIDVPPLHGSAF